MQSDLVYRDGRQVAVQSCPSPPTIHRDVNGKLRAEIQDVLVREILTQYVGRPDRIRKIGHQGLPRRAVVLRDQQVRLVIVGPMSVARHVHAAALETGRFQGTDPPRARQQGVQRLGPVLFSGPPAVATAGASPVRLAVNATVTSPLLTSTLPVMSVPAIVPVTSRLEFRVSTVSVTSSGRRIELAVTRSIRVGGLERTRDFAGRIHPQDHGERAPLRRHRFALEPAFPRARDDVRRGCRGSRFRRLLLRRFGRSRGRRVRHDGGRRRRCFGCRRRCGGGAGGVSGAGAGAGGVSGAGAGAGAAQAAFRVPAQVPERAQAAFRVPAQVPGRAQAAFREPVQVLPRVPGRALPRVPGPLRSQREVFRPPAQRVWPERRPRGWASGGVGTRWPKRLTHVCPPSLVFQRAPSVVPTYSTPSSTGDSASALAVPSSVRVMSGEMAFRLSPLKGERNT